MSDDREQIARAVAVALQSRYPQSVVLLTENTSGCPVIRIGFGPGEAFNLTITRARR